LLWNNCLRHPYAYGGRQVLHGAISADEGKTWHGYREVARDPFRNDPPPISGDHGTAYPFPTALQDGSLLFTTGQGEGRVMIMQLDPAWLEETRQVDDFSGGLEGWSVFGTRGVKLVPHPDRLNRQVLRLAREDAEFPACAVRNFPLCQAGALKMHFLLEADSNGFTVGVADHFSPPFDEEDRFYNLFNLRLDDIEAGCWYELTLAWNMAKRVCRVALNGRYCRTLPLLHESPGPCYLRLRMEEEAGVLVESINIQSSGGEGQ